MNRTDPSSGLDGLESQIALLIRDAGKAVLAATKHQVGRKVGLPQRIFVGRCAVDPRGGRGRTTTHGRPTATTNGFELLFSKKSQMSHEEGNNDERLSQWSRAPILFIEGSPPQRANAHFFNAFAAR